jgi:hypothetical protein
VAAASSTSCTERTLSQSALNAMVSNPSRGITDKLDGEAYQPCDDEEQEYHQAAKICLISSDVVHQPRSQSRSHIESGSCNVLRWPPAGARMSEAWPEPLGTRGFTLVDVQSKLIHRSRTHVSAHCSSCLSSRWVPVDTHHHQSAYHHQTQTFRCSQHSKATFPIPQLSGEIRMLI